MDIMNPYSLLILFSLVIIVSYLFNLLSAKSGIPSVLLLIFLGVSLKLGSSFIGLPTGDYLFDILEVLGIVGLIMIVLEAALDLEINKKKWPVISKSLLVAFASLMGSSLVIAGLFYYILSTEFLLALVYAIPLSIISSAIIIPSVGEMTEEKREFLIYESTFSDIMGIMYFYFLVGNIESEGVGTVVWDVISNIFLTVVLSVLVGYMLIFIFQRLKTPVKLFLLVAVLMLFYSIGKLFHLSSLFIILIFGLILNNYKLFFRGKLQQFLDISAVNSIRSNFHLLTMESAFVVRTLFFVFFGLTIDLMLLQDVKAFLISAAIVILLFGVRALFLKLVVKSDLKPQLFMAPRGLITILLFFAIPASLQMDGFNTAILLYTILITSSAMAVALIASGKHIAPVEAAQLTYWREMDKQIEAIPEQEKHRAPGETEENKKDDE